MSLKSGTHNNTLLATTKRKSETKHHVKSPPHKQVPNLAYRKNSQSEISPHLSYKSSVVQSPKINTKIAIDILFIYLYRTFSQFHMLHRVEGKVECE